MIDQHEKEDVRFRAAILESVDAPSLFRAQLLAVSFRQGAPACPWRQSPF
jgi:hypothetical protein